MLIQEPKKGALENQLLSQGIEFAGVDEVGKGCIAGPVFAAAAILDFKALAALDDKDRGLIRDSKTLSVKQKQRACEILNLICQEQRIGYATVREIESLGIQKATFLAMRRSVAQLARQPELVLIDGNRQDPDWPLPQQTIVKGDRYCYSIAAASIIAKTSRDRLMEEMSEKYPHYGFERHVGYGTKAHCQAIEEHGICSLQRKNFAPINKMSLPGQP